MCKCLYCYKPLEEGQKDFHPQCAKKFFGVQETPMLEYRHEDLDELAEQIVRAQTALTGVQPKLSLNLDKHEDSNRLTIVGLWGLHIQTTARQLSAVARKRGFDDASCRSCEDKRRAPQPYPTG